VQAPATKIHIEGQYKTKGAPSKSNSAFHPVKQIAAINIAIHSHPSQMVAEIKVSDGIEFEL